MHRYGDGLGPTSGGAMKAAPCSGYDVFKGCFFTWIYSNVQSSTAAIVLTVGLVGAGFPGIQAVDWNQKLANKSTTRHRLSG